MPRSAATVWKFDLRKQLKALAFAFRKIEIAIALPKAASRKRRLMKILGQDLQLMDGRSA